LTVIGTGENNIRDKYLKVLSRILMDGKKACTLSSIALLLTPSILTSTFVTKPIQLAFTQNTNKITANIANRMTMHVILDIYNGRPNPAWQLSPEQEFELFKKISHLETKKGYAFTIFHNDRSKGFSQCIIIHGFFSYRSIRIHYTCFTVSLSNVHSYIPQVLISPPFC